MLDIAVFCENSRKSDMYDNGLVRTADSAADGLTKAMQQALLCTCIGDGKLVVESSQTVTRSARSNSTEQMMKKAEAQ